MTASEFHLLESSAVYKDALNKLIADDFITRLFAGDAALWGERYQDLSKIRMGWLKTPAKVSENLLLGEKLRTEFQSMGIKNFVLCGMGGSALGAKMLNSMGKGSLRVLSSTHPSEIAEALKVSDLATTCYIFSSKSGSTVEMRMQLSYVEKLFQEQELNASEHILLITDPGSSLADYAMQRNYRVVYGDPSVGGRFSVLTPFGLIPAVLAGANLDAANFHQIDLLQQFEKNDTSNIALKIASLLYTACRESYIFEVLIKGNDHYFANWLEQLVAESTGKNGVGILPLRQPEIQFLRDIPKVFLSFEKHIAMTDTNKKENLLFSYSSEYIEQIFAWEIATVAISYLLNVNPFDQPDVELTKEEARKLENLARSGLDADSWIDDFNTAKVEHFISAAKNSRYIILQVFLPELDGEIFEIAKRIALITRKPITVCLGPEYLHASGQLHKGGPKNVAVLQLVHKNLEAEFAGGELEGFAQIHTIWAESEQHVHTKLGNEVFTVEVSEQQSLKDVLRLF